MGFISKWKEKIAHYVEVRLNLIRLSFIERASGILSYFIYVLILLFISACMIIFLGIGIAEYLTLVVGSRHGGFLLMGGIIFLLLMLLILLRKWVFTAFSGIFIRMLTIDEEDEEEASSLHQNNEPSNPQ